MESPTIPPPPRIPCPPPAVYVVGFGMGWLVGRGWWIGILPAEARGLGVLGGWGLIVAGLLLMFAGLATCLRAKTTVIPHRAATRLVMSGPYRLTRNPMYVGLTAAYVGGVLLTDNLWCLLMLPAVLLVIDRWVIRQEERYLRAAFGEAYTDYCLRVRRWL